MRKPNIQYPVKITQKQNNIRSKLMRGIVAILLITVIVPVITYNIMPFWVYYLIPATRLWIATESIHSAYDTEEFLDTVKYVEKEYDSNVEIFTEDGRFVYSSKEIINSLPRDLTKAKNIDEEYRTNYEITYGSLKGDKGFLFKNFMDGKVNIAFLDCYQYLPDNSHIEVCMQVSQVATVARIDFMVMFVLIMLVLVLGMFMVSVYIKRLTRPIDTMCRITENMSKLDFSQKCPSTTVTELTALSESINTMSGALDNALSDLQTKNEKLEKDIENERTIDNLRQIFISGISHELKTPIAIIQGYAEGAKMFYAAGNTEAADKYCDIIVDETARMNTMIMRLLEITKYDSGAYEPVKEELSVYWLVEEWFERNDSILKEKGVTVVNRIPSYYVGNGDKIILSSVVNNYLSNALSHVEGEMRIEASCEDVGEAYRVYIFNTGKQIAAKDIDKIWNSFYRADKSLSRSQGRFGLGLAIVASIQRLHSQKYGVENTENGVRFWFDIKKGNEISK